LLAMSVSFPSLGLTESQHCRLNKRVHKFIIADNSVH
jgi:hypothetical protein